MSVSNLMSFDNPVFKSYAFYVGVLVLKMLLMSLLTGRMRFKKRVFCNPEDTKGMKNAKVKFDDPDVERARRAHLNDLENIPVFFVAAWLFLLTDPPVFLAVNLFRVFAIARILHTVVYAVKPMPQPARALSWGVGYGITIYMVVHSLIYYVKGL
ncbi:hypothetical protein RUM43_007752 [Polyplax serrata]|uniref:Microsomal glutathione S-transferase 1 n=1 Tax=Polyplax serrata TaxID=468196 RepID=A0AAN8P6C2_POLSC